jgi:hypothetical protein
MTATRGEFLFVFNHSAAAVNVEYTLALRSEPRHVRELVTGEAMRVTGKTLPLRLALPAEAVRVFRIEY